MDAGGSTMGLGGARAGAGRVLLQGNASSMDVSRGGELELDLTMLWILISGEAAQGLRGSEPCWGAGGTHTER